MSLKVIDADKRQTERERESLCHVHADDKRACKTGPARDRNGIHVVEREIRLGKRLLNNGDDAQHVLARGDFGKHAAITRVDVHLRGDGGSEKRASIFDDGAGGFITGGFDGEDAGGREG